MVKWDACLFYFLTFFCSHLVCSSELNIKNFKCLDKGNIPYYGHQIHHMQLEVSQCLAKTILLPLASVPNWAHQSYQPAIWDSTLSEMLIHLYMNKQIDHKFIVQSARIYSTSSTTRKCFFHCHVNEGTLDPHIAHFMLFEGIDKKRRDELVLN